MVNNFLQDLFKYNLVVYHTCLVFITRVSTELAWDATETYQQGVIVLLFF